MHLAHKLGVDLAQRMMSLGADKIIAAAKIANKPEHNPQQEQEDEEITFTRDLFVLASLACGVFCLIRKW